jgi:hypothetical protein
MLSKTIPKISAFVIFIAVGSLLSTACSSVFPTSSNNDNTSANVSPYEKPEIAGRIESPEIRESSGIAASRCQKDIYWTHNDSEGDAFVYAINGRGQKLGTWRVTGAKNHDWEDIAAFKNKNGECELYVGDIGNNTRSRNEFVIYKFAEPKVSESSRSSTRRKPLTTESASAIRFSYQRAPQDAETLMVHPMTGDFYVIDKRITGAAGVYRLSAGYSTSEANELKFVGELSVPAIPNGLFTGGDISSDGKRVIVCDYFNAYELSLPENATEFDEIWNQKPVVVTLGARDQGEAVAYNSDGTTIVATSERGKSPFIVVRRINN